MHWAVRDKKEPMLDAPDSNHNDKMADHCSLKTEINRDDLFQDRKEMEDFQIFDGKPMSPKSPDSPGKYGYSMFFNVGHHHHHKALAKCNCMHISP